MSTELENDINKVELTENEVNEIKEIEKPVIEPKYQVVSIEKTDTPEGMPGDDWYRYIVGQGGAKIEGLKAGTLQEVSLHAKIFAEDLNGRSKGGNAGYASNKQKVTTPVVKS